MPTSEKIIRTPYHSYRLGKLPLGCVHCVKGAKGVLFITGLCERQCTFCPTSDEKKDKDVIFINERRITETSFSKQLQQVIVELERQDATGIGITGGNPLLKNRRTCAFVRALKDRFGKEFHIHLYTSLTPIVTRSRLKDLHTAGLDEIRFHPEIEDNRYWELIHLAGDPSFSWDIGVEIPILPDKQQQTQKLIDHVSPHISFLNLNELEMADNSFTDFMKLGYVCKDDASYAIKGSAKCGLSHLKHMEASSKHPSAHVCTATLKNTVQLGNRIRRTARQTKQPFDTITTDGLFRRGVFYHPDCTPSFSYSNTLRAMQKATRERIQLELEKAYQKVVDSYPTLKEKIAYQPDMLRIIAHTSVVRQIGHELDLIPAIVIEYPTADHFLVEVEFL